MLDDGNSTLSVIYENDLNKVRNSTETVFKQKRLRDRIIGFLQPADMVALKGTNTFFNFA